MELNLEATGGASDFSRQVELDSSQLNFDLESWDDGYADLERTSKPHLHADSEHYIVLQFRNQRRHMLEVSLHSIVDTTFKTL